MTILFILSGILMLGILVMIHESGHFFAARLTGIPVKEFAIGFGPRIVSWKSKKHETLFFLRAIPAGGYCMFYGEDDTQGVSRQDERSIQNHPVWKRFVTIAMGPVMNFVLALIAATLLFGIVGEDTQGTVGRVFLNSVTENSPAAIAGLQADDVILMIDGQDASGLSEDGMLNVQRLIAAYREENGPLMFTVQRGNENLVLPAYPQYDQNEGRYLIGVTLSYEYTPGYTPVSPLRAVQMGADYCVQAGGAVLQGLKALFTTKEGFSQSAGPVGIVQLIAEETKQYGWMGYVQLLVLISVNLGLFNLIPIPGLDGSRLIFLLAEAIRRKPVNQKTEAYVHMAGYVLLLGLMLVMTCRDILRIFQ